MDARIRVTAEEFDEQLFQRIKALLSIKEGLQVTISINNNETDAKINRAIDRVENEQNLTSFSLSEYEDFKRQLLNEP